MYQHTSNSAILRTSDGAIIPAAAGNIDYQAYLAWVAEGGVTAPYEPPPKPVPQVVSVRQAHRALRAKGLLVSVLAGIQSAINGLPSPQREDAQIDFDKATEWRRDDPLLSYVAPLVNLGSADLDELFTLANTL